MSKHYSLAVHDLTGKRLCTLFDSGIEQLGAASGISIRKSIDGWKEVHFDILKHDAEGKLNFRWDFLKNENLLYLYENNELDVYCIKEPTDIHDAKSIKVNVLCNHICEELKTKNLYRYFDDENGIGTCEELVSRAVVGSGWKISVCDKFYESDGITEKVRTYHCEPKTGCYNMLMAICDLFDARCVFHGADKTIEIHAKSNVEGFMEIMYGKNMDNIKRKRSSANVVTRLYVEGEYGDYGYVGIDDVNPTGLPFILNFDYYKELGLFTEEHQAAVDLFLEKYKESTDQITNETKNELEKYGELSDLIGGYGYVYYPVLNGTIDESGIIIGEAMPDDKIELRTDDEVIIVKADGEPVKATYPTLDLTNAVAVIKYHPTITGFIASIEDKISSAEKSIEANLENLNEFYKDNKYQEVTLNSLKSAYKTSDLSIIKNEDYNTNALSEQFKTDASIEYAYAIGVTEKSIESNMTLLKEKMLILVGLIVEIDSIKKIIDTWLRIQEETENEFGEAMGFMLRDGYWSDNNYVPGQEQSLYNDALAISERLAKPAYSYTINTRNLSYVPEHETEVFKVAQAVRIWDDDLGINDNGIVTETIEYPDIPTNDSIAIKTDLLDIGNKTFTSILERVTQLAEQVRQNKDIYKRAVAISKDGTFDSAMLSGAIDVMRTQLLSSASNWKTDEKGNILMEALDGTSAMMLCGNGFMIANTKNEAGNWDWRTFGTGDGFAADMITTGFLSAERIKAGSIEVHHIGPNVGKELDIRHNASINLLNNKIGLIVESEEGSSELVLTDGVMQAIADKFELIADEIDISASDKFMVQVSNEVKKQVGYRLEIVSTSDILSSEIKQTTLSARVYQGKDDVTDEINARRFKWKRTSSDSFADENWNTAHAGVKSIVLTTTDVFYSATYQCELEE